MRPRRPAVPKYQVTVRYTDRYQRYHVFAVDAEHVGGALARAATELPPEVNAAADLVEVRIAVDPEQRGRESC
jgi:hypothetical protein